VGWKAERWVDLTTAAYWVEAYRKGREGAFKQVQELVEAVEAVGIGHLNSVRSYMSRGEWNRILSAAQKLKSGDE
jgi:hypothetical protein